MKASSRKRRGSHGNPLAVVPAREATSSRSRPPLWLLLLSVVTLATFWPVLGNAFIFFDDPDYVVLNKVVGRGLTSAGVLWAFTTGASANWHPFTWLSHMADVSLFAMNPAGHHATSLLLHLVNSLLLFVLLRSMTGSDWRSALVGALFAVHPAHVESVAWVAERKDVLSTAFGLGALLAYVHWVRRRGSGRYLVVVALYAASLLSKAMLVSLPLVLLLLDYWPLRRFEHGRENVRARVLEKVPLFAMAAASSVVTFLVQRAGGAVQSLGTVAPLERVANAIVSCVRYLRMLVWPANLAIFYPRAGQSLTAGKVAAAAVFLAAISAAAIALRRRAPQLFVGWFWFLVTLLPVIGLVQVGFQSIADRYTYFPFIGLFAAIAWGIPAAAVRGRVARAAVAVGTAAVVIALAVAATNQLRLWKNSEILFLHAIRVAPGNYPAELNLGELYNSVGRPAEAVPHLLEAMRLRPGDISPYVNLGQSYYLLKRNDLAGDFFSKALRLEPGDGIALNNLARVRFLDGEISESIHLYEAAVAAIPDLHDAQRRLAVALLLAGRTAAARGRLERATTQAPEDQAARELLQGLVAFERNPDDPAAADFRRELAGAHREAGLALQARGRKGDAAAHFDRALALVPTFLEARVDRGVLLMEEGQLDEAAAEFRKALKFAPRAPLVHNNLGYVLEQMGRREDAIAEYREALRLQPGFPLAEANLQNALKNAQPR